MSLYSWKPENKQQRRVVPNEKVFGVAYVAFYMYVYIWKLNKDLNMYKMQVNRHT